MTIEINHGIPQSQFFFIAQPKRLYDEPKLVESGPKTIVEFMDPQTGEHLMKAELWDICTMNEYDFLHTSMLGRAAYGCPPQFLKEEMIKRYPELEKEFTIEYWLLKRLVS